MYQSRIFVAAGNSSLRRKIKKVLSREGYFIAGEAEDAGNMLRMIRTYHVDLIMLDANLPGTGGAEPVRICGEDRIAPIVLISENWQKDLAEMSEEKWIYSFLIKPVEETNIIPAVETALMNYRKLSSLEDELSKLKEKLKTRKLVEKAKGIIMETMGLSEAEAFKKIQKESMDRGVSMKELAKSIIISHEMLN